MGRVGWVSAFLFMSALLSALLLHGSCVQIPSCSCSFYYFSDIQVIHWPLHSYNYFHIRKSIHMARLQSSIRLQICRKINDGVNIKIWQVSRHAEVDCPQASDPAFELTLSILDSICPYLVFSFQSESSSLALILRDFKAIPILPYSLFFHLARQPFHLTIIPPRSPIASYDEVHASH